MNTRNSRPVLRLGLIITISTLILAICAHIYLSQIHYNLKFSAPDQASICNVNATFNCAATSASQYSEFFKTGLPMAVLGAFANAWLLIFILYFSFFMGTESKITYYPSLVIYSSGIAITSLVMAFFSSFYLHTYCLVCMFTYLMSFLTLWGVKLLKPESEKPIGFTAKALPPIIACGALIFLASMMVNDTVKKNNGFEDMQNFVNSKVQEWNQLTAAPIDAKAAITEGASSADAKMTIVEFADYLCPHCKHASPTMHAFIGSHPDARIVFIAWPLVGACNSSIPHGDGFRCALARSVYCAEKEHKGWQAHDWIFENQENLTTLDAFSADLKKMADTQKIDYNNLKACMDSAEAKTAIEEGAKIGSDLKIDGTPAIFVNGKRLEGGQVLPVLQKAYEVIKSGS